MRFARSVSWMDERVTAARFCTCDCVAPADGAYESVMSVANKVQEKEGSGKKKRTLRMSGWDLRSGETEKKY